MRLKKIYRMINPRWKDAPEHLEGEARKRAYSVSYCSGGMQTDGNYDAFYTGLKRTRNVEGRIVEIGCFCGKSSNIITYLKQYLGIDKPLVSVDPWTYTSNSVQDARIMPFFGVTWQEYEDFVRNAYKENVALFSKDSLPFAVRAFSNDLFAKWGRDETVTDVFGRSVALGGKIAFAFIDGDHSYEGAMDDFVNVDRYLSVGGQILFDDSGEGAGRGCDQAAAEAAARPNYRLVAKNPNLLIEKIAS